MTTPTAIYLRFADRVAALAALRPHGLVTEARTVRDDDGAEITLMGAIVGRGTGLDRVDVDVLGGGTGLVFGPTGDTATDHETGEAIPVMAARPGFHVNLLWWGDAPPDFGAAAIEPATPTQVFAA